MFFVAVEQTRRCFTRRVSYRRFVTSPLFSLAGFMLAWSVTIPVAAQEPPRLDSAVLQRVPLQTLKITPLTLEKPIEVSRETLTRLPAFTVRPGALRSEEEPKEYSRAREMAAPAHIPFQDRTVRGFGEGTPLSLPNLPNNNFPRPFGGGVKATITPIASPSWNSYGGIGTSADTNLAVSSTHIVVTTRNTIGFYDRFGKLVKPLINMTDFFQSIMKPLKVDDEFDSRCIYDPYRKRFWIGTMAYSEAGQKLYEDSHNQDFSKVVRYTLLAVSKTENPLDGWYLHYMPLGIKVASNSDYLMLGIHERCIAFTNTANDPENGGYINVTFADADAMAAGLNGHGWRFAHLKNPKTGNEPDRVVPVSHHGPCPALYFVGRDGNNLVTWAVTDPLSPAQSVSVGSVAVLPFTGPPAAPQPGSAKPVWFEELGNTILRAVYRNGRLYAVANDAHDWFGDGTPLTSIRLLQATVTMQGPPKLTLEVDRTFGKNSTVDDKPNDRVYYGYPAIEVNAKGDMVMVYSRSGKTVNPEARITARYANGADVLPSAVLKKGESPYTLDPKDKELPWADCAGACVDPVDDTSIWVATCYASAPGYNNYSVWVGRVTLP